MLYLLLVLCIVHFWSNAESGWRAFFRKAYPLFSFTFLYEQTGRFIHLIYPDFFDYQVINWEKVIFRENPTVLLQKVSYPILNEFFYFCYTSYYFLILVLGIYLYIHKRYKAFEKMVTASSIAFYTSYLFFILYPVEGPRYALAGHYLMNPKGYIFVPLANFVINSAGLRGGCMPSSHVAIGVVTAILSIRYAKELSAYYTLLGIGLTIGTFWGRFHYVSDATAGIVLGIIAVWLTEKIYGFRMKKDSRRSTLL